jgi:glycine hydroxymethyltransferase
MTLLSNLERIDPEVAGALRNELRRQRECLEMIPSENFTSRAVLEAMGSVSTNKYSEGYPGKRYYGGNLYIDVAEQLAIDRAKALFNMPHANVQPHAGSPANMAAYFALTDFLKNGKKLMGMELSHGGHMTAGLPVNFSGKLFNIIPYQVDRETELIDYDALRRKALIEKPNVIIAGASAYPREIDWKAFRDAADACGAFFLADVAHIAGLIVSKVHSSPAPYADVITTTTHKTLRGPRGAVILCKAEHATAVDKAVFPGLQGGPLEHIIAAKAVCFKEAATEEFRLYSKQVVNNAARLAETLMDYGLRLVSGGTDNHLILIDVTKLGLSGKEAEELLDSAGITCNKNTIPFDTRKPWDPSGIRMGTPALTTRGMKEPEMKLVGEMIARVLLDPHNEHLRSKTREQVLELCHQFPLYDKLVY